MWSFVCVCVCVNSVLSTLLLHHLKERMHYHERADAMATEFSILATVAAFCG